MNSFSNFLIAFVLILVTAGCKKDSPTTVPVPLLDSVISQLRYVKLMLPQDVVSFDASYQDLSTRADTMSLVKISGPDSYHTWNSSPRHAVLSGLEKGHYQFEWIIKYLNGVIVKDTLDITLYDVSDIPQNASEIVLTDQIWTYPWYSEVKVNKIYSIIPPESLFRVFIKRDGGVWEDVPGSTFEDSNVIYDYFIERRLPDSAGLYPDASLIIRAYGYYPEDTPDVKIVYW